MNCNIIKDYKSIKAQLANGIQCDCKIDDIQKFVEDDYIALLNKNSNYACGTATDCTYCINCSNETTACNRIEITASGPNNLMVSYIGYDYCYNSATLEWFVKVYYNITFNNSSTVLNSIVTDVKQEAITSTITQQSNIFYDTLNMRWEISFKALEDIYFLPVMRIEVSITDGVSTILDAQYTNPLDNKFVC